MAERPDGRPMASRHAFVVATTAVVAWGALAFGAVYVWAYTPLLVAAAALGVAGCLRPAPGARMPVAVLVGVASVAAAALLQLVPLPQSVLQGASPATHRFLQNYSLEYASAAIGGTARHALSIVPARTGIALAMLAPFALLLAGTARMLTRDALRALVGAIAALGVVMTMVGVVQQATWNGKIYGVWQSEMGGSPFGPFVNKNHFAGWMLMALPLVLGLFAAQVSRGMAGVKPGLRTRVLWFASPDANQAVLVGFAALAMGLGLVLTFSRSGMIGLLVATLVAAGTVLGRLGAGARRTVLLGYLLLLPVAVGAWVGFDAIAARFAAADAAHFSGRGPIWQDTWRIVSDFVPFGTGLNTYGYATLFYQVTMPTEHLAEAHNDYLQLAAEGGLLLGVPIAIAIGLFVREVRRRFTAGDREGTGYWVRVGAVTGLVAIAVQSLSDFSLQMPGNAALLAVVAGIALHQAPGSRHQAPGTRDQKPETRN